MKLLGREAISNWWNSGHFVIFCENLVDQRSLQPAAVSCCYFVVQQNASKHFNGKHEKSCLCLSEIWAAFIVLAELSLQKKLVYEIYLLYRRRRIVTILRYCIFLICTTGAINRKLIWTQNYKLHENERWFLRQNKSCNYLFRSMFRKATFF